MQDLYIPAWPSLPPAVTAAFKAESKCRGLIRFAHRYAITFPRLSVFSSSLRGSKLHLYGYIVEADRLSIINSSINHDFWPSRAFFTVSLGKLPCSWLTRATLAHIVPRIPALSCQMLNGSTRLCLSSLLQPEIGLYAFLHGTRCLKSGSTPCRFAHLVL